ncbi:MAG: hypothetical protein OHK0015_27680 [Chloroflexi bacterium OHK40]
MTKLLEPIKAMITPEMLQLAGSRVGLSPQQIEQGTALVMPLIATGMSRAAATPEGQVALMKAVDEADTGVLGNLSGFLDGLNSESGADLVKRLLGDDGRVVSSLVKEHTGIDIAPVMAMAGPIVLGFLNSQVRRGGLDTNGLVKEIRSASRSYERSKDESATVIREAFKAADEVRALKAQLNAEEWHLAQAAPLVAAAQVIGASPSRAKDAERELAAAVAAVDEAAAHAAPTSLVAALFADGAASISAGDIGDASGALRRASAVVGRVSAGELESYRKLVLGAAYAAAQAVKEGGFLGLGAKEVNADEQRSIDAVAAAIGAA